MGERSERRDSPRDLINNKTNLISQRSTENRPIELVAIFINNDYGWFIDHDHRYQVLSAFSRVRDIIALAGMYLFCFTYSLPAHPAHVDQPGWLSR